MDVSALTGATTFTYAADGTITTNRTGTGGSYIGFEAFNLFLGSSADTVQLGSGDDNVDGGAGDDMIDPGKGNNVVFGGAGIDSAVLDFSDRTGDLTFLLAASPTNYSNAYINGAPAGYVNGVERLTIVSGSGNDTIGSSSSTDVLSGGAGSDTVSYANVTAAVSVDLGLATAQDTGGGGTDTLSGFENLAGSAFADTLKGDAGVNIIEGGAGSDTIDGGGGNDIASYANATSAVTASLVTGTATGGAGSDTLISIEGLIGSNHADTLTGDDGDNVLNGGAGDDTIDPGRGVNTVDGGSGTDTLRFDFNASTTPVSVVLSAVPGGYTTLLDGVATGSFVNVERWNIIGGSGDDRIGGVLHATIPGATYTFTGNAGTDTVVVDATAVSASYPIYFAGGIAAGRLYDTYYGTTINITGTEVLEFTGNANVSTVINGVTYTGVYGGDGNDRLTGLNQSDTFWGGKGNNVIDGGSGTDFASSISRTARAIWCSFIAV